MVEPGQIICLAKSKEEYGGVETARDEFSRHYTLKSSGEIFIRKHSTIMAIFPGKSGRIEEIARAITSTPVPAEGGLMRSDSKSINLRVGGTSFVINYEDDGRY